MSHVPDVAVAAATGHNSTRAAASGVRQSTNEVFMVAPTAFGFNDQARAGPSARLAGASSCTWQGLAWQ